MTSWLREVKRHHEGIKQAFQVAYTNPTQPNLDRLKLLLDAHSSAEEATIYPALVAHGIKDDNLETEQAAAVARIAYLSEHITDPSTKSELKDLYEKVLVHAVVHEEKSKFYDLQKRMTTPENIQLTQAYIAAYKPPTP